MYIINVPKMLIYYANIYFKKNRNNSAKMYSLSFMFNKYDNNKFIILSFIYVYFYISLLIIPSFFKTLPVSNFNLIRLIINNNKYLVLK